MAKPTHNQDQMTHKRSSSQDQSTQPLSGSAMKALVRGWIAGTVGLPGDLEGLVRSGINKSFGAGGVNVDEAPALPTTDFYKEWLPGKQVGDENIGTVGSLFGGVGTPQMARGVVGALSQVGRGPVGKTAQAGVIKAPGGNWLSGSVEDALRGLKQLAPAEGRFGDPVPHHLLEPSREGASGALNQFIDRQLTRYVKNDMATERDPVRALAERGTLHFQPEMVAINPPTMGTEASRIAAGFPGEGMGKAQLAKQWETSADESITHAPVGDLLQGIKRFEGSTKNRVARENPWFEKLPAETQINDMNGRERVVDLGFDHLIDELRNATNPNSGLPRELLLKPESLDRVSVPQAVEHVAKINAWREAQKIEANQAIANNAATVLHKEYAENNPKGLRWVELNAGKDVNPAYLGEGRYEDPRMQALKDALKYEGDTMGHCVGGYCDDVASGASRIFSLRDAKGQPHVTVETQPQRSYGTDHLEKFRTQAQEEVLRSGLVPGTPDDPSAAFLGAVNRRMDELAKENLPTNIIQIKGKSNRKPNDEYLPFVQDFVKSGKWSDVGDLQNTGMRRTSDAWNANELKKIRDAGIEVPSHATQAEIDAIGEQVWPGQWGASTKGFADGGAVLPKSAPAPTTAKAPKMTRDEFLKKYGTTFVADDKGGNAASEVAGQDVAAFYDNYLGPNAKTTKTVGMFDQTEMPLDWGGSMYANSPQAQDEDGFSAWDYVNPHPESNRGNGWEEAWTGIIRPVGTMALAAYGANALGGALTGSSAAASPFSLAGGTATFGAATPAATTTAMGMAAPGLTSGGLIGSAAAPGLAGMLGMESGKLSTAVNTGALNTGVGLARGQNIGDALKTGVTSAALSPIGSYVSDAVGGGYAGTVAGNTAIGGAQGLASGRGFTDGVQQGLISGLLNVAGDYVGGNVAGATGSKFAGTAANALTKTTLSGKPLANTIDGLATQYAAGEISDLSGLDPKIASVVVNLARNKKVSASGALTALGAAADRAVGSKKLSARAVGR